MVANVMRALGRLGWMVLNMPATVVATFLLSVDVVRTIEQCGTTTVTLVVRGPESLLLTVLFGILWARAGAEIDRALKLWKAHRMRSQ